MPPESIHLSKAVLYAAGYSRPQVNALGNLCFLAPGCNKWIGAACPAEPSPYVKDTRSYLKIPHDLSLTVAAL